MTNKNLNHSEAGFTLVELIVSVTITAIIMVGVSAFFASSFHNVIITQNELDESQGQFNTNNIIRDKLTGVEEIIEISLDADEKKLLNDSAKSVKEVKQIFDDMKLF